MKLNVFHGSQENFDNIGTNNDVISYAVNGHYYFTKSKDIAKTYANRKFIYEAELTFENPLIIDCGGGNFNRLHHSLSWDILEQVYKMMKYHDRYIAHLKYKNETSCIGERDEVSLAWLEHLATIKGHDSLICNNIKDNGHDIDEPISTTYVAFSSEQVRIIKKNKVA